MAGSVKQRLSRVRHRTRDQEERPSTGAPKKQLLEILDSRVFDPTIRAKADDYSGDQRHELAGVQKTARNTKASYHKYSSAEHVKSMFQDDLRSPYGQKQTEMLHDLGLPAFPDVKDEFMRMAEDLGVH